MLRATAHGPVTRLTLARTFAGRPLHTVSAYLAGGLLIDSGPAPAAGELVDWLRESGAASRLEAVVLTHHHEDHVGGARAVAVRAITRRLLGREGLFTLLSLGDFSKRNLIAELLAGPRSATG